MVEHTSRSRVESEGRGTPIEQWEVFVRERATGPLRHAGSVSGASAADAHQHAARLFDWHAEDIWLCPAGAVERYSTRPLEGSDGDASRASETDDGTNARANGGTERPGNDGIEGPGAEDA